MSHDQCQADEAIDLTREVNRTGATSQRERRVALSLPQILAGALAAASAAAAASWLGLAGTVLGAVVASIVVPVSTALYSHPIERSSQVIRESLPPRPERAGSAGEPTSGSAGHGPRPRPASAPGSSGPGDATPHPMGRGGGELPSRAGRRVRRTDRPRSSSGEVLLVADRI